MADPLSTFEEPFVAAARTLLKEVPDLLPTLLARGAAAAVVLVITVWLAHRVSRHGDRFLAQAIRHPDVRRSLLRLLRYLLYLLALIAVLHIFGLRLDLAAFGVSVGVFSIVLGLILAPFLTRYIAGYFILTDRPFLQGHFIEIPGMGIEGFVEEIEWRYTRVRTPGNDIVIIPNTLLIEKSVVNHSSDPRTRREVSITVSYRSDLDAARRIMVESATASPGVLGEGSITIMEATYPLTPAALMKNFGDNGVEFILRYWTHHPLYAKIVQDEVLTRVYQRFKEAGIEIPYPHRYIIKDS